MRSCFVATHNVMNGLDLAPDDYVRLRNYRGLDVLCVQENRALAGRALPCRTIAEALGSAFVCIGEDPKVGLSILYHSEHLVCRDHAIIELPRLSRLGWLERRYIAGGAPEQKYAQVAVFAGRHGTAGAPFTVVNFHLDTAGSLAHRRLQIACIASHVRTRFSRQRLIACGDTNAFSLRHSRQIDALRRLLSPLMALGAADPDSRPTHYFSRQREPLITHRIARRLGQMGLDLPQRYDVVCTNMPVTERGQVATPGSDHDLVWAHIAL